MNNLLTKHKQYIWLASYLAATVLSFLLGFDPGKVVFSNFTHFFIEMITFIPFLFIIVGLLDVWFPREKIERHIGQDSGIKGIFLMVILAMLQAGPIYVAFPVAYILHKKGASIKNVFIYLGAFSSVKIPMLGMEIGYLGVRFTLARTLVALPLFVAIGYFMEWYLKDKNFGINNL
ncbi:MAG: permease [Desulfobacterales bacterium]|nr:permease [Desulfobacterales bacterium]